MYNITDIGDYLVAQGFGTLGTNLFIYNAPADIAEYTLLWPPNDPVIIDPDLPFYRKGKFQAIVRSRTYENGLTKIKQCQDLLTLFNTDMTNIFVKQLRPIHEPRVFRRSPSGDIELNINFSIIYVEK